ncbi:6711_t:CDS:1, partial [Paraglomus brasilianum]
MEPFTLDYLTKESDQLDEINMDTSNKSQREYELVGVLVHMAPQIQDITIPSSKNASQHLAIRQQKDD